MKWIILLCFLISAPGIFGLSVEPSQSRSRRTVLDSEPTAPAPKPRTTIEKPSSGKVQETVAINDKEKSSINLKSTVKVQDKGAVDVKQKDSVQIKEKGDTLSIKQKSSTQIKDKVSVDTREKESTGGSTNIKEKDSIQIKEKTTASTIEKGSIQGNGAAKIQIKAKVKTSTNIKSGKATQGRVKVSVRNETKVHGYGGRKCGVRIPTWAKKASIVLPVNVHRSVIRRKGCVKTGKRVFHQVKIDIQSSGQVDQYCHHQLETLVEKQVIDAQTGAKILHTCGIKPSGQFASQPKAILKADHCESLSVKGYVKARDRFSKQLRILITRRDGVVSKQKNLAKLLLQLNLDNDHVDIPEAYTRAKKFGIKISASVRPAELDVVQKAGTTRLVSNFKLIQGSSEQLGAFANRLLVILTRRKVIHADIARRLFASFSVAGRGKLAGKFQPFKAEEIGSLKIKGRPLCGQRFVSDLTQLVPTIGAKADQERVQHFVRILLQLTVDNGLRTPKEIELYASKKHRVTINVQREIPNISKHVWMRNSKQQPRCPVHSLVYYHSVHHVNKAPKEKASGYISGLLGSLVQRQVVSLEHARTLLATLNIKGEGQFVAAPGIKAWTVDTLNQLKVTCKNHFARGKFVNGVLQLVGAKRRPAVEEVQDTISRLLLELSLDSDSIKIPQAQELAQNFSANIACHRQPAPQPVPESSPEDDNSDEGDNAETSNDDDDDDDSSTDNTGQSVDFTQVPAPKPPTPTGQDDKSEPSAPEPGKNENGDDQTDNAPNSQGSSYTQDSQDDDVDCNDDDVDESTKPEEAVDSEISFDQTSSANRAEFIKYSLNLLAEKQLIDQEALGRILATFDIDSTSGQQPITEDDADALNIDGTDIAKDKFITALIQLVKSPDLDALLRIILELAVDNKVILQQQLLQLAVSYKYSAKVHIKKVKTEVQHSINIGQVGSYGIKYLSQVEVRGTTVDDNLPFADNLLSTLVDNKLISASIALNLLATFGFAGTSTFGEISEGQKIGADTAASLDIISDEDVKQNFVGGLSKLLASGKFQQFDLISLILQLSLDNALLDIQAAGQLATSYGFSISVQMFETKVHQGTAESSSTKYSSKVTITGSFADNPSDLLQKLTDRLISAHVLDGVTSGNILATFGVTGVAGTAVTSASVTDLEIKGDADAKSKFVAGLTDLVSAREAAADADFDLTRLVKTFLELLLDNQQIQAQEAAQLTVEQGVSISIQEQTFETGDIVKSSNAEQTEDSDDQLQ